MLSVTVSVLSMKLTTAPYLMFMKMVKSCSKM